MGHSFLSAAYAITLLLCVWRLLRRHSTRFNYSAHQLFYQLASFFCSGCWSKLISSSHDTLTNALFSTFVWIVFQDFPNKMGCQFNPTLPFIPRFLRSIRSLTKAISVTVYYIFCRFWFLAIFAYCLIAIIKYPFTKYYYITLLFKYVIFAQLIRNTLPSITILLFRSNRVS